MIKFNKCHLEGCNIETTSPKIAGVYLCHAHLIERDLNGGFTFEQMSRFYQEKDKEPIAMREVKENG